MEGLTAKYRMSIYSEIVEISKGKIYIVKSSLDDKIYIKKILEAQNHHIYEKMKTLSISNVPRIYEIINLDDKLIVIEEYINGRSLKEILAESKTIPKAKVIEYTLALIDIIEELHAASPPIIHKDIKPSNIMINNDGILKLIDFDISRIYRSDKSTDTHILGTVGYAAPEHFGFNQTDARTDIYSLGVTMNMMLVGKLPIEELHKGDLSKIISKCIEIDPNKRYQDVNELKNELLKKEKKYNKGNKQINNNDLSSRLPGFRSGNRLLKIPGLLWYGFLIMISLGFLSEEGLSKDRRTDIIFTTFFFILTLFYGNYKNIRSKLPMIRSKNILIRIIGYILYSFLLFMALGIVS